MSRINEERLRMLAEAYSKNVPIADLRNVSGLGTDPLLRKLFQAVERGFLRPDSLDRFLTDETLYDFPDNLDARLEAVGSSINSELKIAAILALQGYPQTAAALHRRVKALAGDAKITSPNAFQDYYERSLSDIGFLAMRTYQIGNDPKINAFAISDAGERYGLPIAAFSLIYGVEHNISMLQLLGITSTRGDSRAPSNRVRIFELIDATVNPNVENDVGSIPMSKLGTKVSITQSDVLRHLESLKKLGIVDFEALYPEEKTYSLAKGVTPDRVTPIKDYPTLTGKVAEWLYKNGRGHAAQIALYIKYRHPNAVSMVLSGMHENGDAETLYAGQQKSNAWLGPNAELMRRWIKKIRGALDDGPELEEMAKMAADIRGDDTAAEMYLEPAITRYNKVSPNRNRKPLEQRGKELIEFVEEYQRLWNLPPTGEIISVSTDISPSSVSRVSRPLIDAGRLMRIDTLVSGERIHKPLYATPDFMKN